ncbi:HPt domain protein, partial [human gut metagenome]
GCRTRISKCTYIERRVHESWISKLFEVSSALTEELRDKEIKENTTEMFEEVEREYTRTIEAIKGLC